MKRRIARILALLNLLGLICITCGASSPPTNFNLPLGFIILSGVFFLSSSIFWALKGGLFE